jgi:membrane protein implicated in regulation of membrane protease activity
MLIYGGIAAFGVLLLLAMLLVGEVFGGDHDVGGHDVAGHDLGGGHGDADSGGGPSVFSTRIIASFLTAFGVGGVVGRYYDLSHPAASGVGVLVGLVMSTIVYQFAKLLYSQQASSELRMTGLVGTLAEVSVAIPAGGVGQVALTSGGERTEQIARSANGQAIPRSTTVVITAVSGDSLTVTPAETPSGGHR